MHAADRAAIVNREFELVVLPGAGRNNSSILTSTSSQNSALADAVEDTGAPSACATSSARPPSNHPNSASSPTHAVTGAQRKCAGSRT